MGLFLGTPASVFPLSVSSNGRYLETARGGPFLMNGDTPWSIAVQLTHAQIDTYLDDRKAKGFNAILFNMIEHYHSSQSPAYENAQSSANPFTTMTDFSSPNETYWTTVDYIVNGCKDREMICMAQPAYLGFNGGSQGWDSEVDAESDADLEDYGEWLANRYTQGNIIWCMGGDYVPPNPEKQWNIATGILNIDPEAIITAHGSRSSEEAYPDWSGQTGFNLNNIYSDGVEYDLAATAYARSGPIPFFLIEGYYEGETATNYRRQAYVAILAGGCGHFFGNNPIWGFGEPNANGGLGAQDALDNDLDTTYANDMTHLADLFAAYAWELLVPTTDTSLVTTSLGSGTSRVVPALASDGSFAMIWRQTSGTITVDMTAFTPSSVRVRTYDPTDGSYSTYSGSPFSNTGTQDFTFGEGILVLDSA